LTDSDRYPAHVFWSEEDEGFIAVAPDLPGCSAFGETQPEALAELQSAIVAWTEAARAAGNPIPEPSQPAVENVYSGKTLVRMPKSLHAQLAQAAKAEAVSLNQHIVFLLTWATTHRTLTADWTVAVGQAGTYYGPTALPGVGLFSTPQESPFVGQFGAPQTSAWTLVKSNVSVSVSTLPREPTGLMTIFTPQRDLALGSRTA
jgi:antitoxin HicB